ncbi:heat shock 70 kDa protein 12B-like [Mytilus californianus]|uniref:heat shock 70 kDa protein 12B-like n=1 Tax=Mytilus californianus TaxID=6549 RepID=UPI002246D965|nr:heat shock 70 kDa protein 12B-like [Mytilus californianus]
MSTEHSNVTEYTLELRDDSTLDTKGDADDDVSSIDEYEDAVEYLDGIQTNHQHDTDLLSSAEELENLIEAVDGINSITNISMPINTNEVSNTLQYDDIEVSSSLDDLEIDDHPTCTEDGNVVVVAIDFGTTYSGWAFSLLKKFKDDKLDIQTNNGWKSGDGLVTPKVPTCILYNKNEEFNSFGYEAESRYAELIDDNRAGDWRYFSRFKMSLFCDDNSAHMGFGRISSRYKIKDVNGYRMSALQVFADTLKFMKNNVIETLKLKISSIPLQYISWVVTVPAIWTDKAKQFMRLAALEAGIPGTQLTLAYEPEAAALYCRESTYQRKGQLIGPISAFGTGESLLILDCGGGTIDITTYEIIANGRLKELHEPTGGPWGGTMVDEAFYEFIEEIFGTEVWKKYKHEYKSEVLDIRRHFELKKRTVGESSERSELFLQFPRSLFDKYEEFYSKPFTTEKGVSRHRDKLRIPRENIISLFEESTTAIINNIKELLQKPCLVKIKTILLIGGYSDSAILRNKVIEEFSEMTVMCPDDAVLSVVKGAVIFGNSPGLIQERVSPRTYGISCNVPFDDGKHLEMLLEYNDNHAMCRDVFKVLVRKGDTVIIGKHDFETIFHPTRAFDKKATVGIYTSTENDPMYTFGPFVQELGVLELNIPDTSLGKLREIKVCLIFKATELTVIAKEGGNLVHGKFNCLG